MERLPDDILIKEITYLPISDIVSFCQTNKRIYNICLGETPRHKIAWKGLIQDAFGDQPNYREILQELSLEFGCDEVCYNYWVYANFVKRLDPVVQAMIYYRQNDQKSLDEMKGDGNPFAKYYASFLLGNKEEMNKIYRKYITSPKPPGRDYYPFVFNYLKKLLKDGRLDRDKLETLLVGSLSVNSPKLTKYIISKGINPSNVRLYIDQIRDLEPEMEEFLRQQGFVMPSHDSGRYI